MKQRIKPFCSLCIYFLILIMFIPSAVTYAKEIKPGTVITRENYMEYLSELKKMLCPSQFIAYSEGLEKGWINIPVVEKKEVPPPPGTEEATEKYSSQCGLLPNNQLTNFVAGVPFPDPQNGTELAWSGFKSNSLPDDHYMPADLLSVDKNGRIERSFSWKNYKKFWVGRRHVPPMPEMPGNNGLLDSKESILITSPHDVKGFIQLRVRYWDLSKDDECYCYLPALRRIRRMTGSDLTDPLLGSDAVNDDFQVWRQKINPKMTFKILEIRDFLTARYYKGNEDPISEDFIKGNCFQVEWEIRPLYVLEIMENDPNYIYSKRIVYIEKENKSFCLIWGDNYDQKGRLFKSDEQVSNYSLETGIHGARGHRWRNLLTGHSTIVDMNFSIDGSPVSADKFSIKHLLKEAR